MAGVNPKRTNGMEPPEATPHSKEGAVSGAGGDAEQSLSTCLKFFEPAFLSSPKFMPR